MTACNHPSLISKDFTDDKEAVEPSESKDDDEEADKLADLLGAMEVSNDRKCQMCQNTYASITELLHHTHIDHDADHPV